MRNIFWLVIGAWILTACGSGSQDAEKDGTQSEGKPTVSEYGEQVMAVHDEAMAKMGEIDIMTRQLTERRDSLQAAGGHMARVDTLTGIIADLQAADQGMRMWMRNYDPSAADPAAEGAMAYLEQEMHRIEQVRQDMFQSLERAREAMNAQ